MSDTTFHSAEDLRYWLALNFCKDIDPITAKKLLSAFHSPKKIFSTSIKELQRCGDITDSRARAIHDFDAWDIVDAELEQLGRLGVGLLTFFDPKYPEALRQLEDAPILLYIKGHRYPENAALIDALSQKEQL